MSAGTRSIVNEGERETVGRREFTPLKDNQHTQSPDEETWANVWGITQQNSRPWDRTLATQEGQWSVIAKTSTWGLHCPARILRQWWCFLWRKPLLVFNTPCSQQVALLVHEMMACVVHVVSTRGCHITHMMCTAHVQWGFTPVTCHVWLILTFYWPSNYWKFIFNITVLLPRTCWC